MSDRSLLFNRFSLSDMLREFLDQARQKIEGETRSYLLNVNEEEYVSHLITEMTIDPLAILKDQIEISKQFEKVVPRQDFGRVIHVKTNFLTFAVPFTGNRELFFQQPSTHDFNPPNAEVSNNEILITLQDGGDPVKLRQQLDYDIASIEKYISWQSGEIIQFNSNLSATIRDHFQRRKSKFLADAGVIASLGFPLRKRPDAPVAYNVPIRRKIQISKPTAPVGQPYVAHPAIDEQTYNDILSSLRNMALVIERAPSSFRELGEEGIRTHFLLQLNGSYDGDATGETFNHEGKTDILLRKEGRNLFIAECKFWTGPQGFAETIDQLLRYLTWRDTKTAILLFCRGTAVSTVLSKVPEGLKTHPNFIREISVENEGEFRAVFKSARDATLSLTLTVQIYDVPGAE